MRHCLTQLGGHSAFASPESGFHRQPTAYPALPKLLQKDGFWLCWGQLCAWHYKSLRPAEFRPCPVGLLLSVLHLHRRSFFAALLPLHSPRPCTHAPHFGGVCFEPGSAVFGKVPCAACPVFTAQHSLRCLLAVSRTARTTRAALCHNQRAPAGSTMVLP